MKFRFLAASLLALLPLASFSQTKISALPPATTITGTEKIPADQGAFTISLTPAQIAAYMQGLPGGISLSTGVNGNLPVSNLNGGAGATSTTFWSGSGTWQTPTVSIPAINLAAGGSGGVTGNLPVSNLNGGASASGSTFWNGAGVWSTPTLPSAAPTASIGLSTINGSATTYMRSDAAPAWSQSLSPTNTGNWTFTPSSGIALDISGAANTDGIVVRGAAGSGTSFGVHIIAGTTSGDEPFQVSNKADTVDFLTILGDGSGAIGPSGSKGLSWTAAGNETIAAPSSGTAVTINGSSGNTGALVVNGANCTGPCQAMTINGGSNNNNVALALKSNSEGEGLIVFGNTVAGQSHGLSVLAGTNSSDANMAWADASGATAFGTVWGDGGFSIGPVGTADCGTGCLNASINLKVAGAAVLTTSTTLTPNANNLTGTTLNSGVVNSSLTSLGTLASVNVSGAAAVGSLVVGGVAVTPQLTAHVATNQSSTTTTPAATALSLTLPLGSYAIEIFLDFNGTTTGTQGIKFNTTAGTSVASVFLGSTVGSVAATPVNGNSVSNFTFATTSVASSVDFLVIKYSIAVTTAGTYVVTLAQNSSSANATNLLTGSYIIATKI